MTLQDHFCTLARYRVRATRRLGHAHLTRLLKADDRRDGGLFSKSLYGMPNHLLVAKRLLWQRRCQGGVSPTGIARDAEAAPHRARLAQRLLEVAQAWQPFIASLPSERLASTLAYTTRRGAPVTSLFALTLTPAFTPAAHHRSQFTAAQTAMGHPAPVLDLIDMLRKEAA